MLTLLVSSILIFALTQLLPGDVGKLILGRDASVEAVNRFKAEFGLDQPVLMQYGDWLGGFVSGDWGKSFSGGAWPVRPEVLHRMGNSLRLAALTLLLSIPIGVSFGVIAALKENSWVDNIISIVSLSVVGLPEFVTGIVLINVFALGLGWFEASSIVQSQYGLGEWIRVLFLPAVTASFVIIGYIARMTRASMIDELKKNYVRTAKLKGLPYRTVVIKHVLRNALLPTITVVAISIGWLIGGLVVVEQVYNYPGLGSLLVDAVEKKNLPVIQASVMIIVFFFAIANLAADILYAYLNPRIRLS
ncbi:ABC transporter permease [Anaerolineales bacterium]